MGDYDYIRWWKPLVGEVSSEAALIQPLLDEVAQDIGTQSLSVRYVSWLNTVGVYRLYTEPEIWVGCSFNCMNRGEWKAMLYHEMAHVVLGHKRSTHEAEYAADRFTTEFGYGNELISVLLKLPKIFRGVSLFEGSSSHPPLVARIRRIEAVLELPEFDLREIYAN